MPELSLFPYVVRYESTPYSHGAVKELLSQVASEFGYPGERRRWYFETVQTPDTQQNQWIIDFRFLDAQDAIMFGLKYQR